MLILNFTTPGHQTIRCPLFRPRTECNGAMSRPGTVSSLHLQGGCSDLILILFIFPDGPVKRTIYFLVSLSRFTVIESAIVRLFLELEGCIVRSLQRQSCNVPRGSSTIHAVSLPSTNVQ